jgi:biopolymer transport protein ExbD
MKLRRARGYRRGRIEIIPMIDVMFFLLVTFMLASLSMQSLNSLTVNLPQGDAPNLQHKEPVALTITKDSRIFLDKTPTTLATMAFTLKAMLQGASDRGVVVNADRAAPEGLVVEAVLQARRAGVEHFLIAVKRE